MPEKTWLQKITADLEAKGYKVHTGTLKPLDPETEGLLQRFSDNYDLALQKGKDHLTEPISNVTGKCPNPDCGSRDYFPLYGGSHRKRCAKCGISYDGISHEAYLKLLENPF